MLRSFPFLILLIAIIPLTRLLVGTTVGTAAAIVPLTINAIPYFARLVEQNITQLGTGAVEASRAMGATRGQIIRNVLLVDARPGNIGPTSPNMAEYEMKLTVVTVSEPMMPGRASTNYPQCLISRCPARHHRFTDGYHG